MAGTADVWTNWSGSVTCRPQRREEPSNEEELVALLRDRPRQRVRVTGSGHSFVPLCSSDELLISLDRLRGVTKVDPELGLAEIFAGSKLHEIGAPLRAGGLALENMGDIDRQSLAGALSTGTHGTGRELGNLSTAIVGARLVTADAEVLDLGPDDLETLLALRVSLGALGVVTRYRLQLRPTYRLHEKIWFEPADECLGRLGDRIAATRHFEFFWTRRHDRCLMKSLEITERDPDPLDDREGEVIDHSDIVFPTARDLRFNEMEFAVPATAGAACFGELRSLIDQKHPDVEWPIEYRTLAADDAYLSPAHGRDTVTLSVHQAADLPHEAFFADCEAIFRSYEGRPHWGKMHSHSPGDLESLYPKWQRFHDVRRRLDPDGRFLNPYLESLFGPS